MLLPDHEVRELIHRGNIGKADGIGLTPHDDRLVQPASVDVRLDRFFKFISRDSMWRHVPLGYSLVIDPAEDQSGAWEEGCIKTDAKGREFFLLEPGAFVLASTIESISLPDDIAARCEGKSSLGRLGLMIHATAGFIDPGFKGHVTLELANVTELPIKLYVGMKIGQFCFFRMSSPAEHPYGSKRAGSHYQGQRGPTSSRSHENFYRMEGMA